MRTSVEFGPTCCLPGISDGVTDGLCWSQLRLHFIAGGVQTEGLESDSAAMTEARRAVMGLLLHGDAAFAGQGIVAETLQLANTPGGVAQLTSFLAMQ